MKKTKKITIPEIDKTIELSLLIEMIDIGIGTYEFWGKIVNLPLGIYKIDLYTASITKIDEINN